MRIGKQTLIATLVALVATVAVLGTLLLPPIELIRFRNSLVASIGEPGDFAWTPDAPPEGYRLERGRPPQEFLLAATRNGVVGGDSVTIMGELVSQLHSKPKVRGPIKSTTLRAYHEIVEKGRGYCADYTQVFNGLAYAADLPVREWGLSFGGYNGDGHAFNEVYDTATRQWIFVDPMNGFYVRDRASRRPLSVMEFRERLTASDGWETTSIVPIGQSFLFPSDRKAFDYYAEGADQFFLLFGNDVFTYDDHIAVRMLGWSRSLEQLFAILLGIYPDVRILETDSNREDIKVLFRLRYQVVALAVVAAVLAALTAAQLFVLFKRRSRMSAHPVQ